MNRPICPNCGRPMAKNGKGSPRASSLIRYQKFVCTRCHQSANTKIDKSGKPVIAEQDNVEIPIEFINKKYAEFNQDEWFDLIDNYQKLDKKASGTQDHAVIKIHVKSHPIAVIYSSDWHLGSVAVDHEAFRQHYDFVLNNPYFKLITVGDLSDSFYRFKTMEAIFGQIIPPGRQNQLLAGVLNELTKRKKLLLAVWGNHDEEHEKALTGSSTVADMFAKRVPYFRGQGIAELVICNDDNGSEVKYTNSVTHKSRFKSFINPFHENIRNYQLFFPGDVIVTAHTHAPFLATYYHYTDAERIGMGFGGCSYLIKTGTFKTDDTYSQRYFKQGIIGLPTVVYYPDERHFSAYRTPYEAKVMIDAYMQEKGNG